VFGFIRKWMEKKLPHLKSVHRNQLTIQEKGVAIWLQQQEALWNCPQCRTSFTWYSKICPKCGNELESAKDFNR
jgi:predicted amidophosphoribosyltransferase